ncbi:bifunctional phosphopantothenoylcysteine decarboxylase/phosphopantothenate--cysteine ligase CoaBC, partial [Myxococcota bacterium]|nr:bifunctional phosphopantothenoylcysteine decarboxylase/phosphopantothenate--cysteine ligase CoaBC [Myxococcota bacterium]
MTDPLHGARVLLGISGSIAAYKSAELARLLKKRGADVQVVMTEAAQRFITATTLQALTGRPVLTDLWALGASAEASVAVPRGDADRRSDIEHVEQAHGIDLLLVAPATANTLARIACGLADDVLAAIALATRAPILAAPAMEPGMWEAAATRDNCARLAARGVAFVGPAAGELASGRSGVGRMSEPEEIVEAAARVLAGPGDLGGERVLITAGPTWEAIDPVRILSNRSTGAMGIAIAEAAAERGAEVTLVLGPTMLVPRAVRGLRVVRIESAREMLEAARAALAGTTVLVGTAAVSDFRPESPHAQKLKRSAGDAARS